MGYLGSRQRCDRTGNAAQHKSCSVAPAERGRLIIVLMLALSAGLCPRTRVGRLAFWRVGPTFSGFRRLLIVVSNRALISANSEAETRYWSRLGRISMISFWDFRMHSGLGGWS
jgi:hypothetical protein